MSFTERQQMAEKIRQFILDCPGFPVKGGRFHLDGLGTDLPNWSIWFQAGRVVAADVVGGKTIRQPFNLICLSAGTENNASKAAMIGNIDDIGYWLDSLTPQDWPDLGRTMKIVKLEQAGTAHIEEQEGGNLAYIGDFVLEYDQQ